jgi:NAD(P)H dehydrogenase (quinone)
MNRHLIVKALHREESFLAKGTEKLIAALRKNAGEVQSRNLYQLNFNPVLTTEDFTALEQGNVPEDIKKEQSYLMKADFIWFVFPIWWTSMPAILKGYIDRVFLRGFAYRMENDIPAGLLHNKKVIILNSMGMSKNDYENEGLFKAIELTIDKGIFEFSGMKVVSHRYFASIMSADEDLRNKYLKEITDLADLISMGHKSEDNNKSVA